VQVSKIAVFWAVLTFALALIWTVSLNILQLSGLAPAVSLAVPMALGAVLSIYIYFARVHQTLEYDDYGYSMAKGKDTQAHKWSEFKECSIIKDSYGKNKVRVYVATDGEHFDIDSSACGVNPFTLRDFVLSKITGLDSGEFADMKADLFDGFEREIQRGRASWIADLNETFRSYRTSGETFPLMARGGTRPKGFLLSRFLAVTVMPNYEVALYAHEVSSSDKSEVMRLVRIVETLRDQKNIKWSWLVLFSDGEPSTSLGRFIEDFGNKDIGIGCIDIETGRLIASRNQLGRSLGGQMRMKQLMRDLNKRKRSPSSQLV
jgi:hypothetical protein